MAQEQFRNTQFLDEMIPLKGASHADVVSYGVDTPMRYSECFAKLSDGSTARLRNARQFIGWSGNNGSRRLLFRSDAGRILIPSGEGRSSRVESAARDAAQKFITRDGGLLFVQRLGLDMTGQLTSSAAA